VPQAAQNLAVDIIFGAPQLKQKRTALAGNGAGAAVYPYVPRRFSKETGGGDRGGCSPVPTGPLLFVSGESAKAGIGPGAATRSGIA